MKARCPACPYEGNERAVNSHMRKCSFYAEAFAVATTTGHSLLSPSEAYRAAHPPAETARRSPKARRAEPSASVEPSAPGSDPLAEPVADPSEVASDHPSGDGVISPSSSEVDDKRPARRGSRAKRSSPPLVAADPLGIVSVEYWDWEPSLLEQLRSDVSERSS